MALWPSVSRVNAAFLWEIIAVGEPETSAAVAGQKFEFAKLHIEILLQCARKFASRQSANLTIFFPPFGYFSCLFFHPPGLEIAFKLFCQLRKRGVAGSPVRIPLRFRSAVVTCVQFAAKASGNWTQIIIAYFCMRCRFTARRITVIKVEQGEIIRLRQGLQPESMSGRNQL